jgi:antitoxin component YwqK of YwqJK toxin-antitoxin module
MKTSFNIFILFAVLLINATVIGQKSDFNPNTLKAEYFNDKSIKNGLIFNDNEGRSYKIKNSEYSKGLYIKKDNSWKKHGVFYFMSSGRVTSKTIYFYGKKHGIHEAYHSNGKIQFQYNYYNNLKEGKWYQYRDNGALIEEKSYKNNLIEGTKISYHSNGTKNFISTYVNGKREGERLQYNDKGKLISISNYKMGNKIGKTQWLH